ncbi:FIST N-terminal domain-containing protein, partial [Alishewanella longhuensis]
MESTLFPLGREVRQHNNLPFYLLSHPAILHEDGGLSLFSEVAVGEQLWLMHGHKADLIARAGEVVKRTAIQTLIGNEVPIFGGSTADNDVSGKWLQFDGKSLSSNKVILAVFYPSTPISSYFSSGYFSTQHQGTVTSVTKRI